MTAIADTRLLELSKLLPTFESIEKLLQNEVEARYILKSAAQLMGKLQVTANLGTDTEQVAYLIRALVEKYWERIHSGHFSKVPLTTRQIYALGCYYKIFFLLFEGTDPSHLDQCSAILDEAQLLGCTENLYEGSAVLQAALMQYLDAGLDQNLKTLPILPVLARRPCRCDIKQLDGPSISDFKEQCFQALQPALLLNTIDHWPARRKWRDLNYLMQVAGNRTVPIEIGSNYASDEWSQQLVKLRDFLHRQFAQSRADREIEYLAQHELFAQIPALKADICVPDYCSLGKKATSEVDIKAWLGPQGTISPLHYDPKHNLLCQVFGCKTIILAKPEDTENLYPHQSEFLGNTSQVDAVNLDQERFPLLEKVKFYNLVLQPGDCLYMPPKWWHYVRSETPSFSVSFWWE
ncbi:bifunctional peptidase and arginyl-hydroxylase JMJD5 [Scaptodrosophila lebanonensis]|uniref:Bifunctional peptidase and arginyl-hydroxylase JMJD5 n=1 Tax=Drosophila lebanonensis TaxID=7225 RepID=A0A6J2T8F6_DROLE|nr:bifunctional peptidase and arginyl-hydroxylase JMJD5 [Scaptodrosophila lebanonensis]